MSEDGYDHQVERVARWVGVGSAGQGVGRLLGYVTAGKARYEARELSAALVLANGSSLIFVHRNLGFWPYDRQYARPLLAALVAAVLTLASRALLPHLEGLPALLLFAPLTLAVFFGVLVSLGLYPSDRMLLASFADALKGACRREPAR